MESLLDLPKSFLAQLLTRVDPDTKRSLSCASKSAFDLVLELQPGALVLWGTAAEGRLELLLRMGGLRVLLLPDSSGDKELPCDLNLPDLRTVVLNYRLPRLARSLYTSARTCTVNTIIIRGWRVCHTFLDRLSTFLQQLQDMHSLRHLVLTLPCTGPAAAALGKLTQLHCLRIWEAPEGTFCRPGSSMQASDINWDSHCWKEAIQPLSQLTSLQLKVPLELSPMCDLQLEALPELKRLVVLLEQPLVPEVDLPVVAFGGIRAAHLMIQQQLPALQHLTQLVLDTAYVGSVQEMWEMKSNPLGQPPPDALTAIGQLTNLRSLQLTPHFWLFGLRQLQALTACKHLTQLKLAELALGFAVEPRKVDERGSQLSPEEKAVVKAAVAAAAALRSQQGGGGGPSDHSGSSNISSSSSSLPTLVDASASAAAAVAASPAPASSSAGAAAAAGPSSSTPTSPQAAASGPAHQPRTVRVDGLEVQVPLLPQLKVLHVFSLWWRLPLCVVSGRLEDVAYKRLTNTGYGSFVMPDLQATEAFENMVDAELGPGGGIGNIPMPLVEELEDWLNLDMEWIDPAGGGNGNGNAPNGGGLLLGGNMEGDLGPPPQPAAFGLPGAAGNFWQQGLLGGGAHFPGLVAPGEWAVGQQQVGPVAGVMEQQQGAEGQLEEMDVQPGEGGGGAAAAALADAAEGVDAVVAAEQQQQLLVQQLQQQQQMQQQQPLQQQQMQQLHQQIQDLDHQLQVFQQHVYHNQQLPALQAAPGLPPQAMQEEQQQLQQLWGIALHQQQQQQGIHEQLPALPGEVMHQQQQQQQEMPPAADQLQGLQVALNDLTAALNMQMAGQGAGLNQQQQQQVQEAMAHGVDLQEMATAANAAAHALAAALADASGQAGQGAGDALIATATAAAIAAEAAGDDDSLAGSPAAAAAAAEGGGQAGTSSLADMGGPSDSGTSSDPGMDMDYHQDIPRLVYGTDSEEADDDEASGPEAGAADASDPGSDMDHSVPLLVDHEELADDASEAEAAAEAESLPNLVAHNEGPFDPFLPPAAAAEAALAAPPVPALQAALAAAFAAEQEGDLGPPNLNNTLAALNTAAAAAPPPPPQPLADAPVEQMYADVLRGLRGLRRLDVDVTGLCKAMRLSSTPLLDVCELQLHMLGAVTLPAGGLPRLPNLTHLEFYLPDERNWDADYNDDEDLALWQHQSNVQQLMIRGTFHAGGFFAPGHLARAHAAMPNITRLVFMKCRDLKPTRLQEVIDSRLSRYIEIVQDTNFVPASAAATAAAAAGKGTIVGGSSSGDGEPGVQQGEQQEADGGSNGLNYSGSSSNGASGVADAAGAAEGAAPAAVPPAVGAQGFDKVFNLGPPYMHDHGPGIGDKPVATRALEGLWRKRRWELQGVANAAAAVGVEVKLMPVVTWERWYHELLE